MTRTELEEHVGPVYVLRDNKAEPATVHTLSYDGLCAVVFSDHSVAWVPTIDIYPSRRELLLAWEINLMNQRDDTIQALENCRAQICTIGWGVLYREALKNKCADAESGDE